MKLLCEKDGICFASSLAISKNITLIDSAIESYLTKKDELCEKYLVSSANGKTVKNGCEEDYLKELTELNDSEAELDIEKISPAALSNITFSPACVQSISFMLDI